MSIQTKLTELFARDGFYAHIMDVLVNGQNDGLRIPPCEYYAIPFEGDEVVLTDEYRAEIETALGEPLHEGLLPGNMGKVEIMRISVPIALRDDVAAVLLQHARSQA